MSGVAVEHRRPETAEEMKIRDAVESDLPAIIKIYNAAVATRVATAQLEQVTLKDRRGWLKEHSADRHPFWVLEMDRQIAGWLTLKPFLPRCEIGRASCRERLEFRRVLFRSAMRWSPIYRRSLKFTTPRLRLVLLLRSWNRSR